MPRLSAHPLPPEVLRCSALRYIYETTPPMQPAVAPRPPRPTPQPMRLDEALGVPGRVRETARREVVGGRYELERAIDQGGTAFIHLARDLVTGEECAVKI